MRPGVEAIDVVTGTGDEATRDKRVVVTLCFTLPDGTELPDLGFRDSKHTIDLYRRDCIAGVRYGIEGMRVGGRRKLRIAPHLAYGVAGLKGHIPPNTPLCCEVELLDVRERNAIGPEDLPAGMQLIVGDTGHIGSGKHRMQFGLHADGRYGASVTVPVPGLKWRHARMKRVEARMDADKAVAIMKQVLELPANFPDQCFPVSEAYVDHSGHDGGTHRLQCNDRLCLAITLYEGGRQLAYYFIEEVSPAWQSTPIPVIARELIQPILDEAARSRTCRRVEQGAAKTP